MLSHYHHGHNNILSHPYYKYDPPPPPLPKISIMLLSHLYALYKSLPPIYCQQKIRFMLAVGAKLLTLMAKGLDLVPPLYGGRKIRQFRKNTVVETVHVMVLVAVVMLVKRERERDR